MQRKSPNLPEVIPIAEVCQRLNCDRSTVERWKTSGKLKTIKIFGRIYVPEAELSRILNGEKN